MQIKCGIWPLACNPSRAMVSGAKISVAAGVVVLVLTSVWGCGKPGDGATGQSDGSPMLIGKGALTSRCPRGYIGDAFPIPLQLWACPVKINPMELAQPLDNLVVQADCKKKLIGVQTEDRRIDTLWEAMPNGSFSFTIDHLSAVFKDDGSGNLNCTIPVSADFRGHMDCPTDDRNVDQATIHVETLWYLGREPGATPSASPTPSPSALPSANPSTLPSPNPSVSPHPFPMPSATVHPPFPFPFPTSALRMESTSSATRSSGAPRCNLPSGCYIYSSNRIRQCQ